jgi:HK97 family phage prohead protease/HK97 family phage major capsid protein
MVMKTIYGTRANASSDTADSISFVMSDESTDRIGDVIAADGWKLSQFRKNPVALYGHDSSRLPIGRWENVHVEKSALVGDLKLAKQGTSAFTDAVRSLFEQKMLNACSVGFDPIKDEPLDPKNPWMGYRYIEQELLECSVVAVPANANAVVQRSLSQFPAEIRALLVAKSGNAGTRPIRISSRVKPDDPSSLKGINTMKLSELIQQDRDEFISLNDKQAVFHQKIAAGEDLTDEESAEFDQIEADKAAVQRRLAQREATERSIGQATAARQVPTVQTPFAAPAIIQRQTLSSRERPMDLLVKTAVVHLKAFLGRRPIMEEWKSLYPERMDLEAICKAVTNPATQVAAGWAAELVETSMWDFMEALRPVSAYAQLAPRGIRFTFGTSGQIKIPRRNVVAGAAGDLRGAFVGEGQPIPVRRGNFGSVTLTPHKMAVISEFTREIAQHSTPQIEGLIRQGIIDDTAVAIDTALLDAVAGDAIRPAGLLNGVTPITGAAGGDITAAETDIQAALAPFIAANATSGLVWLVNPAKIIALQFKSTAVGVYPFKDQIANGTLGGVPYIQSNSVPTTKLILVRAADFASSSADTPEFDVSDVATIHEDDGGYPVDQAMRPGTSTVLPLVDNAGTPVVAHPQRSLWQTASIGIRMLLGMDWAMRRAGMVQVVTGITW